MWSCALFLDRLGPIVRSYFLWVWFWGNVEVPARKHKDVSSLNPQIPPSFLGADGFLVLAFFLFFLGQAQSMVKFKVQDTRKTLNIPSPSTAKLLGSLLERHFKRKILNLEKPVLSWF